MDAARDGLSEARLSDDGDVVDCSTSSSRCQRSASSSSVCDYFVAETRSHCSSTPRDDDSLTEIVDDSTSTEQAPRCGSTSQVTVDDAEATTTTTASTSVTLLEQLVSSPCEIKHVPASSAAAATSSQPAAVSDAKAQSNLSRNYLQKLESFVSSVGQVAAAPLPGPPLTGWIRRPVFPSESGSSTVGSTSAAVKRQESSGICPYPVLPAFFPSPSAAESSRPLDLSARRIETIDNVDCTPPPQRRHESSTQGSGQRGVEESFVDVGPVQPNGVNFLACLERDFGEHSAILTRLVGSSRERQRQAAVAALSARGGTGRRGRMTAMMPGLMAVMNASSGALISPPGIVNVPQAEFRPVRRSFVDTVRKPQQPANCRTDVVGGKLDSRHPMMSTTTTATALRCLQCSRTFFSLPELTLHMIQSAHYANLICAAAAYSADDEDDCVVVDAYKSRQSSNAGVDHSTHRSGGALQPSRGGKGVTAMADVRREDHLRRSTGSNDARRADYLDAAVSPVRSLDDESVSSAGLTETESLLSPTSSGSPTSPSYENVINSGGASDDDLALMSHLLRLHPLLSRTLLDNRQTTAAVPPPHVDWTALGLAAAEERRRHLNRGRSSKTSPRELDRSPAANSLPIDLRSQRADESRYKDSQSREMPSLIAAAKIAPALASHPPSTVYLEKLLDDVREYRKSVSAGVKRSASSRWYNGKHRTKKQHRTHSISSSDGDSTRYDGPRLNGDHSAITSVGAAAVATSGEVCLQKREPDDRIRHGGCSGETASAVKFSPSLNHEQQHSTRRKETAANCVRRSTPKEPIVINDSVARNGPALSINSRDTGASTAEAAAGQDFRRASVDKDQSEYAARFGKYYRLAQELSSKSD